MTGSGTESDPWQLWTNADLDCVRAGSTWVPGDGGTHGWVQQMADLVNESSIPILVPLGFTYLHYDGMGHTMTIDGVAEFGGVFYDTNDADIRNLVVRSTNGSTLASQAGWFATYDHDSTYTNVGSTGDISSSSGGIIGSATRTTVDGAFSTGVIGIYGGGIVGDQSTFSTVTRAVSTGIINNRAGGIVGAQSSENVVTSSYSTGAILADAGGIVGYWSWDMTVSSSYSTGAVGSNAGGIIGGFSSDDVVSNSFSTGTLGAGAGGIVPADATNPVIVNTLALDGAPWSDVTANAVLTGVPTASDTPGTTWLTCGTNVPYVLAAFYPEDICSPQRTEYVSLTVGPRTLPPVRPLDGVFSLVNGMGTHPFSWISIMNGTGAVRMAGVDCTTTTACVVRDFAQDGIFSRRDVTIVGSGTAVIMRHVAGESPDSTAFTVDVVAPALPATGTLVPLAVARASLVLALGAALALAMARRLAPD